MKYPQLVSMPSAISDWLEEQLEARGIDAIVYTRYVLSLLHRDSLDLVSTDQDIQIPKEVRLSGRGRKRFRRSTEWWSHVRADVEQLRRSAAVECLMSASDQKCGIESLVDELCEKLKHFESSTSDSTELDDEQLGGGNNNNNKSEKNIISPNDLARRYYAAFPPLNYTKASSANDLITLIPQLYTNSSTSAAAASNKRKHGRKTSSHHYHQHRSTSRDALQQRNRTSAALDSDSSNMKSRSGGKQQRFSYFSRAKKDFGFARNMEKSAVDRSDLLSDWDLYFMNGQNNNNNSNSNNSNNNRIGDEGYSTSDTTGVDESEDVCEIVEYNSRIRCRKSSIDDGHLAKLVAKFDRRIEALWNTDEDGCVEETQNVENEYHDLPVDIQELLASPTKQESAAVELLNVANKWAMDKASKPFIQCGTNITSSIWSECADEESDKSLYDSTISYCNLYNEALEKSSYSDNILGDQFNSLSMGAEKLSDDIFMAAVSNKSSSSSNNNNNKKNGNRVAMAENEANMLYEEHCPTENSKLCCFTNMKLGSLKQNEFTSLPWELAFSVGNFNNKKWSDAENYSYIGDSKFTSPLDSGSTGAGGDGSTVFTRTTGAVDNIITLLNHNKESSVFKEVVPKPAVPGLPAALAVSAQNDSSSATGADSQQQQSSNGKEEEDLLTSTRTHFRPIKQETATTGNADTCGSHGSGAHYADGTTFAIRSSLEHVNYRRSESGTLYLESGFDSPKRYMEYRIKDVAGKCDPADANDDNESCCYSIEREFVLKFCVKQNEKYCQTEQQAGASGGDSVSAVAHSPLEVPAKKRVLCDPEEFFFPGDEDLLSDSIDNSTSSTSGSGSGTGTTCECSCSRTRAKLATSLEPLFNASSETCSVHATRPDSVVSELAWNNNNNSSGVVGGGGGGGKGVTSSWKKCDKCNNNWSTVVWPKQPASIDHVEGPWIARDVQSWQHIWSSNEELCRTCLGAPAGSGLPAGRSLEYFKLRDELSEDGEQLLSDLSCLQRNYMEQLPSSAEMSCDLNEPLTTTTVPAAAVGTGTSALAAAAAAPGIVDTGIIIAIASKERKRRHSSSQRPLEPVTAAAVARNSWTNASCLRAEQRCPFTPPLLRPVTL